MPIRSIIAAAPWLVFSLVIALFLSKSPWAWASDSAVMAPAPAVNEALAPSPALETAVFAGGCFWGVQGVFQHVKGVTKAVSGYTGGDQATASYETVSTGKTGHAEAVEVTYDPSVITYGQLLQIYFSVITDPTELNRQGPDHGSQYRTALFYQTPEQQKIGAAYIEQLGQAHVYSKPIVTTEEPFKAFYPAEEYHQDFLALNPTYPYIAANDMPKVENLQRLMPADYREQPVLVLAH